MSATHGPPPGFGTTTATTPPASAVGNASSGPPPVDQLGGPGALGGGPKWKAAEQQGLLHLFFLGVGGIQQVQTEHGESSAMQVDHVVRWNRDGVPCRWDNQLIFGAVLTQQLGTSKTRYVAGVISKGQSTGSGRNAPWVLKDASEEQLAWIRQLWSSLYDGAGNLVVPEATDEDKYAAEEPF